MKRFVRISCAILALVCVCACFVSCESQEEKSKVAETIKNAEVADVSKVSEYVDALEAKHFKKSKTETNYVMIEVSGYGKIVVALRPDVAPVSAQNFKDLVSEKFYDGLIFHRVIKGFMIQGGGYTSDFKDTNAKSIKGEFKSNGVENNLLHVRGVLSMARTSVKDSASSQFFLMHADSPHLDGDYAAFGYVIAGIEVVDKIANVKTGYGDWPISNVVIKSAYFVSPIAS